MFTNPSIGLKIPVLFPTQGTHSEINMEGWVPTSAGFYDPADGGKTYSKSDSLGLEPVSDDAEVISMTLVGAESLMILRQEIDRNLARIPIAQELVRLKMESRLNKK